MNDSAQFSLDSSGLAQLSGPLTLDTVAAVYQQANGALARGQHITSLDLKAVSRVDSSGLALLLEWQSKSEQDLPIRNAPPDLLSLAGLCEASDLLAIDGRTNEDVLPTKRSETTRDDC